LLNLSLKATTASGSLKCKKAENIILADQGITPLYNKTEAWMVNSKVKGLIYNGAGANYNFKSAYVK
jgi:oligopeptide transport system substrate-binding protein